MTEAVIVATGRTPIGRANKGSLIDCRPDDLSALIIGAVLDKVPDLDRSFVEDVIWGCGQTAENVREVENVSREEMDEFAVQSQERAVAAQGNGFFEREITPVTTPKGDVVTKDDGPRAGTTIEKLATLQPVFRPDGQVTAGNACPLNDGAAAVVVMSDRRAEQLGITPLARIVASGVSALDPEIMGLGPIDASRQVLARAGM